LKTMMRVAAAITALSMMPSQTAGHEISLKGRAVKDGWKHHYAKYNISIPADVPEVE